MNYFELYDLAPGFELDLADLSARYQRLQQLTHPDKFATASDAQKRVAMQKNAQINDAFQVLKSPLLRAEHMLMLRGIELRHDQTTMQDGGFLMQQMEWREQLDDIRASRDSHALELLQDEVTAELKRRHQLLAEFLDDNTQDSNQLAGAEIAKLKFLVKLNTQLDDLYDQFSEDL